MTIQGYSENHKSGNGILRTGNGTGSEYLKNDLRFLFKLDVSIKPFLGVFLTVIIVYNRKIHLSPD